MGSQSLLSIPHEILRMVISQCDVQSLKMLRLTNHITCSIASEILFYEFEMGMLYFDFLDASRPDSNLVRPAHLHDRWKVNRYHGKGAEVGWDVRYVIETGGLNTASFLFENVRELHVNHFGDGSDYSVNSLSRRDRRTLVRGLTPWTPEDFRLFVARFTKLKVFKFYVSLSLYKHNLRDRLTALSKYGPYGLDDTGPRDLSPITSCVTHLCVYAPAPYINIGDPYLASFQKFPNLRSLTFMGRQAPCSGVAGPSHSRFSIIEFLEGQEVAFNLHTLEIGDLAIKSFPDGLVPRFLSKLHTLSTDLTEPTGSTYPGSNAEYWAFAFPKPTNTIWDSLLRHSVALRFLTVGSQSEPLLKYLISSPHPLDRVDIKIQQFSCMYGQGSTEKACFAEHAAVERFMTMFWREAIPVHKSTLRELGIRIPNDHRVYGVGAYPFENLAAISLNKLDPWGFTDDAKIALKGCQRLESLHMGTNNIAGLKDAIDIALEGVPPLRKFKFTIGRFPTKDIYASLQDSTPIEKFGKEGIDVMRQVAEMRWDKKFTEARWKEVAIELVPWKDGSWWVERDGEGETEGSWRLIYSEWNKIRDVVEQWG
ncbi:hypothetical protein TWF718_000563 [Orbilia javanica]|uniref:F-box domain-containing protein n=1 Tax=Orbilia javanica TaxID=47235 RepID=A0AAN8RRQ8_9PEZI